MHYFAEWRPQQSFAAITIMKSHKPPACTVADSHPAQAAGDNGLDLRTRIRIALFLARRRAAPGQATLRLAALRERGRAAGMNTAEMLANEAGSSHEARAGACLAFVATLLAQPDAPGPEALRRMHEAGYRPAEIAAVIAAVMAEVYPDAG